jgi:hypothetical protein
MSTNFKFIFPFVLIIIFSTSFIFGQSKFEYGIGIMINHSQIDEQIFTESGPIDKQYKGLSLPAVTTRIGYKHSKKFHLNTGIGFSWLGSLRRDLNGRIIATTLEAPLQLEWNAKEFLQFRSGLLYNYILSITAETDQTNSSLLEILKTKHQIGLQHGVAFSHKAIELSLSYAHYFTNVFELEITDSNGNSIGSSRSKFGNIQLGVVFRG